MHVKWVLADLQVTIIVRSLAGRPGLWAQGYVCAILSNKLQQQGSITAQLPFLNQCSLRNLALLHQNHLLNGRVLGHVGADGWEVYKLKLDKKYPLGFPIVGKDVTFRYSFDLNVTDDESDLQKHEAAVADLISEGVDFIANAQPNFAKEESVLSNKANLINIHGVTSNAAVFEQGATLLGYLDIDALRFEYFPKATLAIWQHAFHRYPTASFYSEPISALRDAGVKQVAIVYRGDLAELRVACKAAIRIAVAEGLPVQEIVYTTSEPEADHVAGQCKHIGGRGFEVLDAWHTCSSNMCHDHSAMFAFFCSALKNASCLSTHTIDQSYHLLRFAEKLAFGGALVAQMLFCTHLAQKGKFSSLHRFASTHGLELLLGRGHLGSVLVGGTHWDGCVQADAGSDVPHAAASPPLFCSELRPTKIIRMQIKWVRLLAWLNLAKILSPRTTFCSGYGLKIRPALRPTK
eukprot:1156724-Pelagomonas_calceolata.AAC.14